MRVAEDLGEPGWLEECRMKTGEGMVSRENGCVLFPRCKRSQFSFLASQILAADLKSKSIGAFGVICIRRFRELLHQIAVAVAMRHLVLAHRPRDLILIETEQQKIQRDGIKLHRNCSNAEPSKNLNTKGCDHLLFQNTEFFPHVRECCNGTIQMLLLMRCRNLHANASLTLCHNGIEKSRNENSLILQS